MWKAITRAVSPAMNRCELSFLDRSQIDIALAKAQHCGYEDCLRAMGCEVTRLAAEPDLPDSVFVEDPALALDEVAVLARPAPESRRAEGASLERVLARFRPVERINAPATLEGGDVMRVGKTLYVGASGRTNHEGIAQLAEIVRRFGYDVRPVGVRGCLHLKSGCTYLGGGVALANRAWIDADALEGLRIVDVQPDEPWAANVLAFDGAALMPDCFPNTAAMVERLGWKLHLAGISELRKAEAGVTCCSLIFAA
jgi:dimethylargininase